MNQPLPLIAGFDGMGWGMIALLPISLVLFYLFAKYDNFELTMLHSPRRGGKAYWTVVTIFAILWVWAYLNRHDPWSW